MPARALAPIDRTGSLQIMKMSRQRTCRISLLLAFVRGKKFFHRAKSFPANPQ